MTDFRKIQRVCCLYLAIAILGCTGPEKELHYLGDKELGYYRDYSQSIEYPHVHEETPEEVTFGQPPRTLRSRDKDEIWNLSLEDSIQTALENNDVVRVAGTLGSANNPLLSNPNGVASIYDISIQETGVLFGGRGVEAALSQFDAQVNSSMIWGRNEALQNSQLIDPFSPATTAFEDVSETGAFRSGVQKIFGNGGQFSLNHNWDYLGTNRPGRNQLFRSTYTGTVSADYRLPLWAGAGTEFTQTAGPISTSFQGISGVNQGVAIARINNDLTIADFEANVRNLVSDVENLYWQLHLAYRVYDSLVVARNSSLRSWREAKAILDAGGARNFKPADEAQARDQYFQTRAESESALSDILSNEVRFRRLLGLSVNDGKIIRPADEPVTAEFIPDWYVSLTEALLRRVELRRQKWSIKSLQLQLKAAHSLTNPRLDFVTRYVVNGFGDDLISHNDDDSQNTTQGLRNGYETITQGDQTGYTIGAEMTMPIGFRAAHTQVQNVELRLAKARALLRAQEMDISHELALAFQDLARHHATARSNFNRWRAAKRREDLFKEEVRTGTTTLDFLLRAQASLAQAEIQYYRSIIDYNLAITQLHFRKGTLLEHNNVHVMESDWTPDAYREALRRAWARSHGIDSDKMHAEPRHYVAGEQIGEVQLFEHEGDDGEGTDNEAEKIIPVPAPENDTAEKPSSIEQTSFQEEAQPASKTSVLFRDLKFMDGSALEFEDVPVEEGHMFLPQDRLSYDDDEPLFQSSPEAVEIP